MVNGRLDRSEMCILFEGRGLRGLFLRMRKFPIAHLPRSPLDNASFGWQCRWREIHGRRLSLPGRRFVLLSKQFHRSWCDFRLESKTCKVEKAPPILLERLRKRDFYYREFTLLPISLLESMDLEYSQSLLRRRPNEFVDQKSFGSSYPHIGNRYLNQSGSK